CALPIFNLFGLIPWNPASIPLIGDFLMIGPFALLYGVTMIALQGMSAPPTDPMQRMIMRWIPLVFTILFAGFAVGLVIYWVWSNIITIVQQYIIMRRTGIETEFDKFLNKHFRKKAATPAESELSCRNAKLSGATLLTPGQRQGRL